jgi:UDP-N-acetylmuramoyl-L-alanyl-D-glutamate--2,6-diaminopimelate ligase
VAVLNADDPVAAGLAGEADGPVLTVGIDQPAEIAGQIIETFPSEQTFLLSIGSATAAVRTTLIGKHNVANCLQAAAVGAAYGIDLATIVRGIEAVDRVPGRLERLECGQPFSVYVDYAHTPDALASALDAVRAVTRGRVICLFGAGGERDRAKRPRMGREAERRANLLVLTDDNPRGEDPRIILSDILSGLRRPFRAEVIPDRAEAIAFALSAARPGDSVVLAGKGHEDYQITNNFRLPFDDAAVARDWLCRPQTIRLPHAMRVE